MPDAPALPPAAPARLTHIDAVRGLMLVMMAIDHVPSDLQVLTDHVFGYVSAAAGFVLLAGLMAGWVYSRHRRRVGAAASRRKILARAGTIYRAHLVTYGLVFAWAIGHALVTGTPSDAAPPLMVEHPWAALLLGPALLYQPGLLDVLPMYCLFLLALPGLLTALERGRAPQVLALSFGVWLATNLFASQQPWAAGWVNLGAFDVGAWQFVFVIGVLFGFAWAHGRVVLPRPHPLLVLPMFALAAWLWAIRHGYAALPWDYDTFIWLTNKNNVAPLRLLDAAIIAYAFAIALRRFPRILHAPPLALLGRNSLQVFAAHVVAAECILFFAGTAAATVTSRAISTALLLGVMFLAAGANEAWKRRQARPAPAKSTLASPSAPSIV